MDEEPPICGMKNSIFKNSSLLRITFILICLSIQISNSFPFSSTKNVNIDDNENFPTLTKNLENSDTHVPNRREISNNLTVNNVITAAIIPYEEYNFDNSNTVDRQNISMLDDHYNISNDDNCTEPAINDFPSDGLTRQQRRHGWILIHLIFVIYGCWLLAIICDNYFVPCIEYFCNNSEISADVIGATLMAATTSSPELFVNCVGTFLTQGDIGVGTVVGSAVFNVLAVPAFCGLFVKKSFYIDCWPVSRDCLMYFISVIELICILYDGKIMWYEALMLILSYCIYIFGICYYNDTLSNNFHKIILKCNRKSRIFIRMPEITPLLNSIKNNDFQINYNNKTYNESTSLKNCNNHATTTATNTNTTTATSTSSSFTITSTNTGTTEDSTNNNPWIRITDNQNMIVYVLRWPIKFILWLTIPDCKKWPNLRYFTLILCIIWIGIASYLVSFFTTVIGDTFNVPDSVMGITILAIGMSIPEAVSSIIVTKQGHGIIGISNSIGSNIFDILLSLGIPWFIKSIIIIKENTQIDENYGIKINSNGLIYSVSSLIVTLLIFYTILVFSKFKLNRNIGIICLLMYGCFIILASFIEMNYFFDVNLPICDH